MTALISIQTSIQTAATAPKSTTPAAAVYLARLAPGSRRSQAQALASIAALLAGPAAEGVAREDLLAGIAWGSLRYEHTQAVRAHLAATVAPSTANKALSALRGVLKEAWRLGLMGAEDYQRASDLENVKGTRLQAGREVAYEELARMFSTCRKENTAASLRDAALLAVLAGAGLRRDEAAKLDMADYDATTGAMRVQGKGNKARITYATNGSRMALEDWCSVRGSVAGPLFCAVDKVGRVHHEHRLTTQAIWKAVDKRRRQADIAPMTPHDLRRTYASRLLDAGADISSVQQLMGHASVTTTQRYDRRGEAAKQRAASLLSVPY